MINRNPAATPEQILRQTSLAKGWHRITIGGRVIQVFVNNLEGVLKAAYDPANPAWLDRISCRHCDDDGRVWLCVDGCRFRKGFIL